MAALYLHEDGTEDEMLTGGVAPRWDACPSKSLANVSHLSATLTVFSHCLGLLYVCPQIHKTFKGYAIMTMVVVIETVSGDPIRFKSVSRDSPR